MTSDISNLCSRYGSIRNVAVFNYPSSPPDSSNEPPFSVAFALVSFHEESPSIEAAVMALNGVPLPLLGTLQAINATEDNVHTHIKQRYETILRDFKSQGAPDAYKPNPLSVQNSAPTHTAPIHGVPNHGGLTQGLPNHALPTHGGPNQGLAAHGPSTHGAPPHGAPPHGGPSHGGANHGGPSHGVPTHGPPGHGGPSHTGAGGHSGPGSVSHVSGYSGQSHSGEQYKQAPAGHGDGMYKGAGSTGDYSGAGQGSGADYLGNNDRGVAVIQPSTAWSAGGRPAANQPVIIQPVNTAGTEFWVARLEFVNMFGAEGFNVTAAVLGQDDQNIHYILASAENRVSMSLKGYPANDAPVQERLHMAIQSNSKPHFDIAVDMAEELLEVVCNQYVKYCIRENIPIAPNTGFIRHMYTGIQRPDGAESVRYIGNRERPKLWLQDVPPELFDNNKPPNRAPKHHAHEAARPGYRPRQGRAMRQGRFND